jgi:hypothetical protein
MHKHAIGPTGHALVANAARMGSAIHARTSSSSGSLNSNTALAQPDAFARPSDAILLHTGMPTLRSDYAKDFNSFGTSAPDGTTATKSTTVSTTDIARADSGPLKLRPDRVGSGIAADPDHSPIVTKRSFSASAESEGLHEPRNGSLAVAQFDFAPSGADELPLHRGQLVVLDGPSEDGGWWSKC